MDRAINKRIKDLINYLHLSDSEFAKRISVQQRTLSAIFQRDSDVKYSILSSILEAYPYVSSDWLMKGSGSMFMDDKQPINNISEDMIPLVLVSAISKSEDLYAALNNPQGHEMFSIPVFDRTNFLFQVFDPAMEPTYKSGDYIACGIIDKELPVQWNNTYLLFTNQGMILRRIQKSVNSGYYKLVADNVLYESFEISLSDVFSIAMVRGIVRVC